MEEFQEATLKVGRFGRITIPHEIRQTQDIEEDDFVVVKIRKVVKKE